MGSFLLLFTILLGYSSAAKISMFHISDLHLDANYSTKGNPQNLCHEDQNSSSSTFQLGPAGNYNCDPPKVLIKSAFRYMSQVENDPDIIIWTGDSNPHYHDGGPDFNYIFSNLKNISGWLNKQFPGAHIIPALGNHDTFKADNYPDFKVRPVDNFYSRYIEQGAFGDFLQGTSRETFKKCGYYSKEVTIDDATLKFIVLNTNLYYYNNETLDEIDPCDQISWTRTELEQTTDQQVFILAHVAPGYYTLSGDNKFIPTFTVDNGGKYMNDLLSVLRNKTLAKKVTAHFYGHSHHDSFRIFMDHDEQEPVGLGFIGPSITPFENVNPSVRIYYYDTVSKIMLDFHQHILPLNEVDNEGLNREGKGSKIEEISPVSQDRRLVNTKFAKSPLQRKKRQDQDQSQDTTTEQITTTTTTTDEDENTTTNATEETTVQVETTTVSYDEVADDNTRLVDKLVSYWRLSYNATSTFGVLNLSIRQMYIAYHQIHIQGPGGDMYKKFCKHYSSNYKPQESTSDLCSRYTALVCPILYMDNKSMEVCMSSNGTRIQDPDLVTESATDSPDTTTDSSPITTTEETDTIPEVESTPEVKSTPDDQTGSASLRGVAIGFAIVILLALAVGGLLLYRRVQKNRYRSQEFLLTDSVFRYDGYAQVDET